MKIQLWSYNYAPEPTGIAPVSATWAQAMSELGHEIHVIAAHPHYPTADWGSAWRPYREKRDGISVTRLPLLIGRGSAGQRMRQEASFAISQIAALPFIGKSDAVVAVSPCFPALSAAIMNKTVRNVPWVLWLQDILPDGAVSTGILDEGRAVKAARRLETSAYRSADRVVVISERFESNLKQKGTPASKLVRIYNPATKPLRAIPRGIDPTRPPRILVMGNIGHSQGLPAVVRAFEASDELERLGARLVITGTGVGADEVVATITTDRVEFLGLVSNEQLDEQLELATVGLVSQRSDLPEFNLPSKLMNYLARALPVIASVGEESEVARLVSETGAGWVVDNSAMVSFSSAVAAAHGDPAELEQRSTSALEFARANLDRRSLASRFDHVMSEIAKKSRASQG